MISFLFQIMSLSDFSSHFWGEVAKKCGKAVVFIDTTAAEW